MRSGLPLAVQEIAWACRTLGLPPYPARRPAPEEFAGAAGAVRASHNCEGVISGWACLRRRWVI